MTSATPIRNDGSVNAENAIEHLSEEECWELLGSHEYGRLAVSVAGKPDIFPVNYVVYEDAVVFRTAEGSKLASVAINSAVAFEIDGYDPANNLAWSVVLHGHAVLIDHGSLEEELEHLPLFPWNITPKRRLVEIKSHGVHGRRFEAKGRQAVESTDSE